MFLSSTTDKVQLTTSGSADITYNTHYAKGSVASGELKITGADNKVGLITSGTDTDISGSPAGSDDRWAIDGIEVCNIHATTANTVTITLIKAGGTARQMIKVTLQAGEKLTYSNNGVWFVYDSSGGVKMGAISASDTQQGLIQIAVQSDLEAGSSLTLAVTPGRQHYHPSAVKCWGFTTGGGTPALDSGSYNVTSITDTATGRLTVTIANDFSSANWCGSVTCTCATNANRITSLVSKAAGSVILEASSAATTLADPGTGWDWQFVGDL